MAEPPTPEQMADWIARIRRATAGIDIQAHAPVTSSAALCHLARALREVVKQMEQETQEEG